MTGVEAKAHCESAKSPASSRLKFTASFLLLLPPPPPRQTAVLPQFFPVWVFCLDVAVNVPFPPDDVTVIVLFITQESRTFRSTHSHFLQGMAALLECSQMWVGGKKKKTLLRVCYGEVCYVLVSVHV